MPGCALCLAFVCVCMVPRSAYSWSRLQHEVCLLDNRGGDHELPQLLLLERVSLWFLFRSVVVLMLFSAIAAIAAVSLGGLSDVYMPFVSPASLRLWYILCAALANEELCWRGVLLSPRPFGHPAPVSYRKFALSKAFHTPCVTARMIQFPIKSIILLPLCCHYKYLQLQVNATGV